MNVKLSIDPRKDKFSDISTVQATVYDNTFFRSGAVATGTFTRTSEKEVSIKVSLNGLFILETFVIAMIIAMVACVAAIGTMVSGTAFLMAAVNLSPVAVAFGIIGGLLMVQVFRNRFTVAIAEELTANKY